MASKFLFNPITGQLNISESTSSGGSGIQTINSISPDGGGNFTLTAGSNITLTPGTNAITIASSGGGSSTEGVSLFVVDSQGNAGYTTISAAITAAALIADVTTPQTVWVWPGTYTEDLTLVDYVNLSSAAAAPVIVNGSATYTPSSDAGIFVAENITFSNVFGGGAAVTVAGNFSPTVYFNNCEIIGNFDDAFAITNTQSPSVFIETCFLSTNDNLSFSVFNVSNSSVTLFVSNTECQTGRSVSIFSDSVFAVFSSCVLNDCYELNSGAHILYRNCAFNPEQVNTNSIFNISSGSLVEIYTCDIRCNTDYWATGAGGIIYGSIIADSSNTLAEIDPSTPTGNYKFLSGPISFDKGVTGLDTFTQGTVNQVVLGTGTSAVNVVSGTGTSGQILTSNGTGSDPTWQDASGGSLTIEADSGSATGSTLQLFATLGSGSADAGSSVAFIASGTEIDLQTTDSNQNTVIGQSAGNSSLTSGGSQNTGFGFGALGAADSMENSVAVGYLSLNASVADTGNTAIGWGALSFLNGGSDNVAVGLQALNTSTADAGNTAIGVNCLLGLNGGGTNTAIGYEAGFGATTGSNNIYVGANSGNSYTSTESSNILVGSSGVLADQNTIRIGTQGSSSSEQDSCYIAGIFNTNSSGFTSPLPVWIDSTTGQLGYGTTTSSTIDLAGDTGGTLTSSSFSIIADTAGLNCGSSVSISGSTSTLTLNVTDGAGNTVIGSGSGNSSVSSMSAGTTSLGSAVLTSLTTGQLNTIVGYQAAQEIVDGNHNTGVGSIVFADLISGEYNIGLGRGAASSFISSESNNIIIGNNGTIGDNNTIRIGTSGSSTQEQNKCFIAAINGITVTGSAVLVSSSDQLGVAISSRKYKDNIEDMNDSSSSVLDLRPVTFTYKGCDDKQFGLIAEEVQEVMPELVVYDKSGDPQTVQYHVLPALLLNEIQKLNRRIEQLEVKVT